MRIPTCSCSLLHMASACVAMARFSWARQARHTRGLLDLGAFCPSPAHALRSPPCGSLCGRRRLDAVGSWEVFESYMRLSSLRCGRLQWSSAFVVVSFVMHFLIVLGLDLLFFRLPFWAAVRTGWGAQMMQTSGRNVSQHSQIVSELALRCCMRDLP